MGAVAERARRFDAHPDQRSEGTVKAHMKSILPKLGARDRTHAVMTAVKRGIIEV